MADQYETASLWQKTLAADSKDNDLTAKAREKLRVGYFEFRARVKLLIAQIQKELPDLTLHDITHVDALWDVASTVAGKDYPLNPAEAFVLGGAFLLHDAAHCCAAFKGGFEEIKQTAQWRAAAAAKGLEPATVTKYDPQYAALLFDTLRLLHPIHAEKLSTEALGEKSDAYLLHDEELRNAYGHVIGAVAKSHWSYPHELEAWHDEVTTTPVCLGGTGWQVDWLKLAVLLRVADALHMDSQRAPAFLLKIAPPSNAISRLHWDFQSHLNTIACDEERQEIRITGQPFAADKQAAWWQAYDTARMADKELDAAYYLLRDNAKLDRRLLAAREVAGVRSPEAFARYVKVKDWTPVDTEVRITQVQQLVQNFGGEKLYGDKPHLALRELLQNAIDAVHACRKLGGLSEEEGEIEVALDEPVGGKQWLHVTDTGIGMSKYVLTQVLMDFGRSLWRSGDLKGEWGDLAASGFDAIGQFGIGFFSVFMLSQQVKVTTKRWEKKDTEPVQWTLHFSNGTKERPVLREPTKDERLMRHGTRVSIRISSEMREKILHLNNSRKENSMSLEQILGYIAPALDLNLIYINEKLEKNIIIERNDWEIISDSDLANRINPNYFKNYNKNDFSIFTTKIVNNKNITVGRLSPHIVNGVAGVGVYRGLRAGSVSHLHGIVFCKNQNLLDRSDAIPDITLEQLKLWANAHKKLLPKENIYFFPTSANLMHLGADCTDLIIGRMRNKYITYHKFDGMISDLNKIIIYKGRIDKTNKSIIINDDVLEMNHMKLSKWLFQINKNIEADPVLNIIINCISKKWQDYKMELKFIAIGKKDAMPLEMDCYVVQRLNN
jgi:hypothetical protein